MTLAPGTKLGPYEILAPIGAGGMGEVYRAHDSRVGRDVAIKVSSEHFSDRFTREIHAVAALNHSNVCTLYDVGSNYLVMELVEGPTLADRIKQGPIPLEESLGIARQIADALEAAHEKGIVHRDLKPGNIKIRPDGTVKVLDFGLAKVEEAAAISLETSPTLSIAQTAAGVLLGTAAYMSPEQARGKTVDKRADIWAFGVVLYEMLTGRQLFSGETVSDTLAATLKEEPDFEKVPAKVRPLLRSCLEKNPSHRLRDIGDVWRLVEGAPESVPAKRPWLGQGIAVLAVLVALALAFVHFFQKEPTPARPIRFQIAMPDKTNHVPGANFALSPDGSRLAFAAIGSDGVRRLWIRALDSLEAYPLSGTEFKDPLVTLFFWSPDSRFIAFHDGGKLKKIAVSGGPPWSICDTAGMALGGSWNRDGVIIFGDFRASRGLLQVSSAGGVASQLTRLDTARQETEHSHPTFLPDGRHFLYFRNSRKSANTGVYMGSLDSKPEEQSTRQILADAFAPVYVASQDSGPGQLLFIREQTLMAQPFDDRRLVLVGEALPVVEKVDSIVTTGLFSASTNGILVYRTSSSSMSSRSLTQPTWFDREGKALGERQGEPGLYTQSSLSPDGKRAVVVHVENLQSARSADLWMLDFQRSTNTRFTFGQGFNRDAVWSPDGSRIIFASNREGIFNLYQKPVTGIRNEELLLKSAENKAPSSWSSDGRFLLYSAEDPKTKVDLWVVSVEGNREPIPLLRNDCSEYDGYFSPNMRWIAYVSDESGKEEIWVRAFSAPSGGAIPAPGGKWLISKGGGTNPRWRGDGKELYYLGPDRRPMVVEVTAGTVFQAGTPKLLSQAFPTSIAASRLSTGHFWDVTADGSKIYMIVPAMEISPSPFTVVLNWASLPKK